MNLLTMGKSHRGVDSQFLPTKDIEDLYLAARQGPTIPTKLKSHHTKSYGTRPRKTSRRTTKPLRKNIML